jgi:hypothetical protein
MWYSIDTTVKYLITKEDKMETIKIWIGRKGARNGLDNSDYEIVEFTGQELGYWRDTDDPIWNNRGTDFRAFQTEEGTILIHRVDWSRWANEDTFANILEFASLNDATRSGWRTVLENAGVIPRRVRSLREWRAERERQQQSSE